MTEHPIGILDSGLGGLTIWREIRRAIPQESTIYIGDHAHLPYSGKSVAFIRERVKRLITFLLEKNAKLIVVACNTATVAGIDAYRTRFPDVPIIGVVPVVKTAAAMSKTKRVAVLSTPHTAASRYQKRLIETFANGCTVKNIGVPDLAALIEKGAIDERVYTILYRFLSPLNIHGVDIIALGCTHYLFVKDAIQRIAGIQVMVIDSGGAVARHTSRILAANKLRSHGGKPYTIFYTTGNEKNVTVASRKLTGQAFTFTYAKV